MINLYNFMDGIDGMAISGALFISIVASILSLVGGGLELSIIFFLLAVSSVGFIIYNWPPARIFMGDAGSIFLGYCFGALVLKSSTNGDISFWIWVIILSYFLVDTTVTLLLRIVIVRRYLPHRSHAYQNLARIWNSHAKVTGLVMAYHFIWILPLSVWATIDNDVEIIAALLAIVPVILLTLKYGPIFSSS
jgi:Fuc2NAc and GlcNAc transferase